MAKKKANDYRARLIAARMQAGLKRGEMAKALWTPRSTYMQWETVRRTPGIAVLAAELLFPKSIKEPEEGTISAQVLRLADGRMTVTEIARRIDRTRSHTHAVISNLRKRGLSVIIKKEE